MQSELDLRKVELERWSLLTAIQILFIRILKDVHSSQWLSLVFKLVDHL